MLNKTKTPDGHALAAEHEAHLDRIATQVLNREELVRARLAELEHEQKVLNDLAVAVGA